MKKKTDAAGCPCGSGKAYAQCCQPLHAGGSAASPEALMRSRYSAYALGLEDYLLSSWHPATRPASLGDLVGWQWIRLTIDDAPPVAPGANHGFVEFTAVYRLHGRAERLHERSRFEKFDGRWVYRHAQAQ